MNLIIKTLKYVSSFILTIKKFVHQRTCLKQNMKCRRMMIFPLKGLNSVLKARCIVGTARHIKNSIVSAMFLFKEGRNL